MKRILLKFIVVFFATTLTTVTTQAQSYTYSTDYFTDAGNPGGLNTEGDAPGLGTWNDVMTGPQAANVWSGLIILPFPFDFYGETKDVCFASQNGVVVFGEGFGATPPATLPGPNFNLPSVNFPDTAVGFWDEFTAGAPTGGGDNIRTNTFGTAPNRQFWIKWYSFEIGNPTLSFSYFAIVLEETTNKIYIVDQSSNTTPALTATVGVQLTSSFGVQFGDSLRPLIGANGNANTDNDYWEFTPELLVTDNAGISAFVNPFSPLSAGLQNVDVTLENYGTNVLDSVMIAWEVDGVPQTGLNYTTAIPALGSVSVLNIGMFNFPSGTSTIKAWTSMPNGVADADVSNDTIELTLCTSLNGTYTVGPTSTDFLTINDAADALINCGISGPVIFNIEPGIYNEFLTLPPIVGASATNTITINGGNAATTSIDHDGAGQLSIILLDGADYFIFENLTFNHTGTIDTWGIRLTNVSDFNTIRNCVFNQPTTPTADNIAIVGSSSATFETGEANNCNYLTIDSCIINNGSDGIHIEGLGTLAAEFESGFMISNNTFNNILEDAIEFDNVDSVSILNNIINADGDAAADGIDIFDIMNFNISGNTIISTGVGFNLDDGNFDGAPVGRSLISNNMIISDDGDAGNFDDTEEVDVFHNSFSGATGLQMNDVNGMDVRNNIFVGSTSFAFENDDVTPLPNYISLDYNIYESGGATFVEFGPNYADLAAWQTALATINLNSLEGDPNFIDPLSDLHIIGTLANDVGDNTVGVTVDIDGDNRPFTPSITVDIGADEVLIISDDAGVVDLISPSTTLCSITSDIEVDLFNFGTDTLTSAVIDWTLGGVAQTPFNFSGSIPPSSSEVIVIATGVSIPVGANDFVISSSLPNGNVDLQTGNDSLSLTRNVQFGLNGSYTLDPALAGSSTNFQTFDSLQTALISVGVCGPVVVNVAPGAYTEFLTLPSIVGASNTNTITINGGNAATTSLDHDGVGQLSIILLDGADYFIFENLTFNHTGTIDTWGIRLTNASDFNTIRNCVFNQPATPTFDNIAIVGSSSATFETGEANNCNYLTIDSCIINNGSDGIHIEGLGTLAAEFESGFMISNNTFNNILEDAIEFDNVDSVSILNNVINADGDAAADGIDIFDIMNFNISGNTIISTGVGFNLDDGNFDGVPAGRSLISNNMIISDDGDAGNFDDTEEVDVFHNSFSGATGLQMNDVNGMDVRNNIFVGSTSFAFENDDVTPLPNYISLDYNIYESGGANFVEFGPNYADLAAWQTALATINVNSLEGDPIFSDPVADLHIVGTLPNDVGDNSVGITTDIDGDTRPLAPAITVDIGADEYKPSDNDAVLLDILSNVAPCGDSTTIISVIVQNLGLNNITSLPITLDITGSATEIVNFTYPGNIGFGTSDTVAVHLINTYAGGTYNISAYVNLAGDEDLSNDSLPATVFEYTPFEPVAINGSACGLDSGLVYADSTYTFSFDWYDAPTGGNLVGSGASFTIPSIAAQNTYYLEYGAFSDTIETIYNVTNGCGGGNMFDIDASITTSISGFCVNTDVVGTTPVTVHYIIGSSYVGNETNAAAWTNAGTFTVTTAGTNNPSCFSLTSPITIPAGQTVAIYLEYNANYQSLTATYTNTAGNITISTGAGLCSAFGGVNPGRTFSGSVIFGVAPCSAVRVPATIPLSPTADLGSDTSSCTGSYTLSVDSANAGFNILWSNGDTTLTTTVTSSGTYSVEVSDTSNSCVITDTVVLSIGTPSLDTIAVSGCDMLMVAGMNQTTSGFVSDSLTNAAGCDSVVVYDVTILNSSASNLAVSICMGDSILLPDGSVADTAGTYVTTITNAVGCDSVITTILDMYPLSNVSISGLTPQICDTAGVISVNLDPLGGTLSGSGITGSTFDPAAAGLGFTTITYEVADSNGCDYSTTFEVEVIECIVGIRGISGIETISVYPNPYTNSLRLIFEDESSDELNISLFDALGRNIISENVQTTIGMNTIELNIPDHAAGVTFIQFERNGKTYQQNLIKR